MSQGHKAGTGPRDMRWEFVTGTVYPVSVTFTYMQFIKKIKNNSKKLIQFLYCSVMCDNNNNNNVRTTIYEKLTHIDKLYVAYSPNHLTTLRLTR